MLMTPDTRLAVTLTVQQWNMILAQLSEGPYKFMAPLIHEVQRQCATPAAAATVEGQDDEGHSERQEQG